MSRAFEGEAIPKNWKRLLLIFLVGVPIASAVLLLTQSDLPTQIAALTHQTFSPLKEPYRYPFDDSLTSDRDPATVLEHAIAAYQQRVRQDPSSGLNQAFLASAYLNMARVTGEGNWYLLADEAAQQSFAKFPLSNSNSEAVSVLARIAEARHDFPAALRLSDQVAKPEDQLAIRLASNLAMGKLKDAGQEADQLVDAALSMNSFMLQAVVRTAQGKDQQALQSFRQGLSIEEAGDPTNSAHIRTLLGRFYYERGQLKLAGDFYREALHILPSYPLALVNLAQLEIRQGQYSAAEGHYNQLDDASQGSPTIYTPLILRGKARIKQLQGDLPAANELWSQAETLLRQSFIGTSAGSFGHRRDLARLMLERGRPQDIPEAVSLMRDEVKIRRDGNTLNTFAWTLLQAGRSQEAQKVIQEAIALGTREAGIYYQASLVEQALGNHSQTQAYAQQAKQIDPQFDDRARLALGLAAGLGS